MRAILANLSRRKLLAVVGAAATTAVSAACMNTPSSPRTGSRLPAQPAGQAPAAAAAPPPAAPAPAAKAASTASMTHTPTSQSAGAAATARLTKSEEMDKHHEAGVKAFPAKTARYGNERLAPKLDGDVKVFEITATNLKWEVEAGKLVDGMAYNGMIPGPEIRVTEGDKVRIVLKNGMDESTSIHFHGQHTLNKWDGVPFITQPPVKPGETFVYEFVARPAGSHMYHSHHNAAVQVPGGLFAAFIVDPKDAARKYKVDAEHLMIVNDGSLGFTLNGKSFPSTQPLVAKVGQKLLIRYMNEGQMLHPMHLHGFAQQVVARDGYPLPQPYLCDTVNVAPGERWDVIVEPDEPGVWAFHCHILGHAESPNGMFGMVTALIVEK